jgi:hypothetical protein
LGFFPGGTGCGYHSLGNDEGQAKEMINDKGVKYPLFIYSRFFSPARFFEMKDEFQKLQL